MLYQRYQNPMPLLDGMISTGRFTEFVYNFVKASNEDKEEKTIWECWLHKVHDKSLKEFRDELKQKTTESAAPTQMNLNETVKVSFQMLEGFSLVEVQEDGTIQTAGDNSG